eukprot:3021545-Pyramimonas_sp.AAC.2
MRQRTSGLAHSAPRGTVADGDNQHPAGFRRAKGNPGCSSRRFSVVCWGYPFRGAGEGLFGDDDDDDGGGERVGQPKRSAALKRVLSAADGEEEDVVEVDEDIAGDRGEPCPGGRRPVQGPRCTRASPTMFRTSMSRPMRPDPPVTAHTC